MVVAAHDVRDAEVDVVDDGRELVRRRAVLAHERDAFESSAQGRADLAMTLRALALPHRAFIPWNAEPFEVFQDRLLSARNVPRRIGVVDPQQHPLAQPPIRGSAQGVAEMKRACGARREADSGHPASV